MYWIATSPTATGYQEGDSPTATISYSIQSLVDNTRAILVRDDFWSKAALRAEASRAAHRKLAKEARQQRPRKPQTPERRIPKPPRPTTQRLAHRTWPGPPENRAADNLKGSSK